MFYLILGVLGLGLFVYYYFFSQETNIYFKKKGIPYNKPTFNKSLDFYLDRISQFEMYDRFYKTFKTAGIGGLYSSSFKTIYLIVDPELIKSITIKDFDHFMNHMSFAQSDDIFSKGLVGLKDNKWKEVRSILSPAFTGNKMRIMFELIEKCALKLEKYLHNEYEKEMVRQVVKREMKELMSRFTNDAIATTAFGIEVDSVNDEENEFFLMGQDLVDFTSGFRWLKFPLAFIAPKLMKILYREGVLAEKPVKFFRKIFMDNINSRKKHGIIRPDMIHLMLEATKEEREKRSQENSDVLTDEEMLAQAILFFFAGFDTVSRTVTFAFHHLAEFPDIQEKLHEEIKETLEENNGKINYEILMKMPYLEMFLCESQRILPGTPVIDRQCSKRYTIPATDHHPEVTIEPGEIIFIPPYSLHHDPDYFPDPEKFIPERFSEENKSSINPSVYLPFGIGPRFCIANRFAKMEVKLVLFHVLKSLEVIFIEETVHPIKFSAHGTGMPKKGCWLGFKPRINAFKS